MVTFGASGAADGGHTVLAHVGGSHLTDSTFGSVIEIGLSSPDCLLAGMLVFYSDGGHAGYLECGTVKMARRPNLEMAITESDDTIRNILERDACLLVNAGDRIGNVRERRERHFEAAPDRQACRERFGRILTRRRGDAEHPPGNDASQKLAFVLAVFHHFVERHATLGLRHHDLGDIGAGEKRAAHLADFIVESRPVLRDVIVQHRAREQPAHEADAGTSARLRKKIRPVGAQSHVRFACPQLAHVVRATTAAPTSTDIGHSMKLVTAIRRRRLS